MNRAQLLDVTIKIIKTYIYKNMMVVFCEMLHIIQSQLSFCNSLCLSVTVIQFLLEVYN